MPETIIIQDSTFTTYNTNARGPMATPYEYRNNVKRFNEGRKGIYGGANLIGDNPLFNFGFRQPYVWTSLNDSDFKKYIKRYDTLEMPIGSVAQDAIRIGKFLTSGPGILFLGRQFLLQSQAPFNETSLYNPLSVPQSVLRPASLGLLPRPTRHIEIGGSLLSNLLNTFGFGGGGVKPSPAGTTAAQSNGIDQSSINLPFVNGRNYNKNVLPIGNESEGTGLIRARTANLGSLEFDKKWDTTNGTKPGFLTKLISHFAPGLTPLPKQHGYYRSDEKSADYMLTDLNKSNSKINSHYNSKFYRNTEDKISSTGGGVIKHRSIFRQPYSPSYFYSSKENIEGYLLPKWEKFKTEIQGEGVDNDVNSFNSLNFTGQNNIVDVTLGVKGLKRYSDINSSKIGSYEELKKNEDIGYGKPVFSGEISDINNKLIDLLTNPINNSNAWIYRGEFKNGISSNINDPKVRSYGGIPDKSNRNAQSKSGEYNDQGYIKTNNFKSKKLDDLGLSAYGGNYETRKSNDTINDKAESDFSPTGDKNDLIYFFFKDLVNLKWIQFRAVLSGISINNSSDWESFRYLGRSDQVYVYKGFTQDVSFNFKIYPNNETEMDNIWKKADYLTGLSQPAGYKNDLYIIPPMVSLTIGKIFDDQPIILKSINVSISDESSWDIDKELPHFIEISISADIIQTKIPNTRNGHFGFSKDTFASKV